MEAMQVGEEHGRAGLRELLEVFECGLQGVALEEDAALEIAEAIARGTRGMTDRCVRLVERAFARDPRAPAEVDVFEVGEVIVVERAELYERRAARDHVASAREQQLVARARLSARAARRAQTR